jgi:glycosyltransferase involved in cell wall biosynthesis
LLRICGYGQDRGACTQLRIVGPLNKVEKLRLADVEIVTAGDGQAQEKVEKSDVVLMGRAASEVVGVMIDTMHSFGKYVVYDLDDNMFGVGPFSPHYKDFGIMPVNMDHPDLGSTPMWVDGVGNFDVKRNRKLRQSFINIVRKADCVTVSTPPLQKLYSRFHDNVVVMPNAIDFGLWKKPDATHNSGKVRVLYTGAANHREDWMFVKSVLEELQKKYDNWTLVLVGMDWHNYDATLDNSRVEYHGWADIDAYPFLMKSLFCDIGITPISESPFNDCRSSIKWLEYSALKMATVATNYGPYARDCKDGDNVLLVKEKGEWFGALSRLLEDEKTRKGLGERAYRSAKARFDLDHVVDQWMDVFNQQKQIQAIGG